MNSTAKIALLLGALVLTLLLAIRLRRGLQIITADAPPRPAAAQSSRGDWVELAPMPGADSSSER